jgi:hypothetical protein
MLTKFSARSLRPLDFIPERPRDDPNFNALPILIQGTSSTSFEHFMTPESVLAQCASRWKRSRDSALKFLSCIPCSRDQQPAILFPMLQSEQFVESTENEVEQRSQRAEGILVIQRNAQLYRLQLNQSDSSPEHSDDDEHDWDPEALSDEDDRLDE